MQLTIDSKEPLDRVLQVVSSLYGVELSVGEKVNAPARRGRRAATKSAAASAPGRSARTAKAAGTTRPAAGSRKRRPSQEDLATVRAWARAHGHQVSDRGRVANAVLQAYRESNSAT